MKKETSKIIAVEKAISPVMQLALENDGYYITLMEKKVLEQKARTVRFIDRARKAKELQAQMIGKLSTIDELEKARTVATIVREENKLYREALKLKREELKLARENILSKPKEEKTAFVNHYFSERAIVTPQGDGCDASC